MDKKLPSLLLLTALFLSFSVLSSAQVSTRISIANGSWSNPAIWSPAGVPTLSDDSIIINTNVTYNQNITDGQYMFRINSGASLIDLGNDTATFGCDRLVVDGYFSCFEFVVGTNDSATISGIAYAANELVQSGLFIVQSGGQVCVGQMLATSDNFINNGSVSAYNFTNGATVTGNQGKFCIANWFINTDNISGTLDICDATPNTPFDVNAGTISGNITYCANGPCGICPAPNGINENFAAGSAVEIFPNPFTTSTTIKINPVLLHSGLEVKFELFDVTGKEIKNEVLTSAEYTLNRENLSEGLYFYRLILGENSISNGKIIIQ
ncbi:hypothetical protein BH09BAC5_BH09BAC5_05600 [soil metagenome]